MQWRNTLRAGIVAVQAFKPQNFGAARTSRYIGP
jgi:hypothetical protein